MKCVEFAVDRKTSCTRSEIGDNVVADLPIRIRQVLVNLIANHEKQIFDILLVWLPQRFIE